MARGLFNIVSVVNNGGSPPRYTLTVSSTSGILAGDHVGARLPGEDPTPAGLYLVVSVPGPSTLVIEDSLTEGETSAFGAPDAGRQAGYGTPEALVGLSQLPFRSPGWDAAVRRNNALIDPIGTIGPTGPTGATGATGPITDLGTILSTGNATSGTDILVSTGDEVQGQTDLTLRANSGDVIVEGDLVVNGSTTTISTTNTAITDQLLILASGSGSGVHSGLAIERGATGDDALIHWNETDDRFEFGLFNTVGGTVAPGAALGTLVSIRADQIIGVTADFSTVGITSNGIQLGSAERIEWRNDPAYDGGSSDLFMYRDTASNLVIDSDGTYGIAAIRSGIFEAKEIRVRPNSPGGGIISWWVDTDNTATIMRSDWELGWGSDTDVLYSDLDTILSRSSESVMRLANVASTSPLDPAIEFHNVDAGYSTFVTLGSFDGRLDIGTFRGGRDGRLNVASILTETGDFFIRENVTTPEIGMNSAARITWSDNVFASGTGGTADLALERIAAATLGLRDPTTSTQATIRCYIASGTTFGVAMAGSAGVLLGASQRVQWGSINNDANSTKDTILVRDAAAAALALQSDGVSTPEFRVYDSSNTYYVGLQADQLVLDTGTYQGTILNNATTLLVRASVGTATGAGNNLDLFGGAGGATSGNAGNVRLIAGTPVDGNGGSATVAGSDGVGTNRSGGSLFLNAGDATGSASAGSVTVNAGTNTVGSGAGGDVDIDAGAGAGGGGDLNLRAGGGSGTGTGGTVLLQAGNGAAAAGGALTINAGNGDGFTNVGGDLTINAGVGGDSGNGGTLNINAGNGGTGGAGNGGNLNIAAGSGAGTAGFGGTLNMNAGDGVGSGITGGDVYLFAGQGGANAASGTVFICAYQSNSVNGRSAVLEGGQLSNNTTSDFRAGASQVQGGTAYNNGSTGNTRGGHALIRGGLAQHDTAAFGGSVYIDAGFGIDEDIISNKREPGGIYIGTAPTEASLDSNLTFWGGDLLAPSEIIIGSSGVPVTIDGDVTINSGNITLDGDTGYLRVGTATDATSLGDLSAGVLSGNRMFWSAGAGFLQLFNVSSGTGEKIGLYLQAENSGGPGGAGMATNITFALETFPGGAESVGEITTELRTNNAAGSNYADMIFSVDRNGASTELLRLGNSDDPSGSARVESSVPIVVEGDVFLSRGSGSGYLEVGSAAGQDDGFIYAARLTRGSGSVDIIPGTSGYVQLYDSVGTNRARIDGDGFDIGPNGIRMAVLVGATADVDISRSAAGGVNIIDPSGTSNTGLGLWNAAGTDDAWISYVGSGNLAIGVQQGNSGGTITCTNHVGGGSTIAMTANGLQLGSAEQIHWRDDTGYNGGSADLYLTRVQSGVIALSADGSGDGVGAIRIGDLWQNSSTSTIRILDPTGSAVRAQFTSSAAFDLSNAYAIRWSSAATPATSPDIYLRRLAGSHLILDSDGAGSDATFQIGAQFRVNGPGNTIQMASNTSFRWLDTGDLTGNDHVVISKIEDGVIRLSNGGNTGSAEPALEIYDATTAIGTRIRQDSSLPGRLEIYDPSGVQFGRIVLRNTTDTTNNISMGANTIDFGSDGQLRWSNASGNSTAVKDTFLSRSAEGVVRIANDGDSGAPLPGIELYDGDGAFSTFLTQPGNTSGGLQVGLTNGSTTGWVAASQYRIGSGGSGFWIADAFQQSSAGVLSWAATTNATAAQDTFLYRVSEAILALRGDAGTGATDPVFRVYGVDQAEYIQLQSTDSQNKASVFTTFNNLQLVSPSKVTFVRTGTATAWWQVNGAGDLTLSNGDDGNADGLLRIGELRAYDTDDSDYAFIIHNGTSAQLGENGGLAISLNGSTTTFAGSAFHNGNQIYGDRVFVEEVTDGATSPRALSSTTDMNRFFTNEGATGEVHFDLPTASAGRQYTFYVQDADGIQINATASATIRIDGSVSSSNGSVSSSTVGDLIKLVAINSTEWIAFTEMGTWTTA